MKMPIGERLDKAFAAGSDQRLEACLQLIRANWTEIDKAMNTALRDAIIAMAAYEFLARAAVRGASIAGLEFSDLGIVRKLLPGVVAYFYYRVVTLGSARRVFMIVHDEAYKRFYPDLYAADLERFFWPPSVLSIESLFELGSGGWKKRTVAVLFWPVALGVLVVPATFAIYANVANLRLYGWADQLVVGCALLSVLFLVKALLAFLATTEFEHQAPVNQTPTGATEGEPSETAIH